MFKFFKKDTQTKAEKMEVLILKQTNFSIKAISLHPKLLALAPDKSQATYHSFVFNNWLSYYLLVRHICAALPATTSDAELKTTKAEIKKKIIVSAKMVGLPQLEKDFRLSSASYYDSDSNFEEDANFQFFMYDDSIARHETPDWVSAAVSLSSSAELPGPYDDESVDITKWNKTNEAHQREVLQLFKGLENVVRPDVIDYMKTPK